MNFLNKFVDDDLHDFVEALSVANYTKSELKGDFSVLDKFPAIGFRTFSKEPLNNGGFNVIENINYLIRSDALSERESGIVLFDSYISLTNSHMQRKRGSISSMLFGSVYDRNIGFTKMSCMKPRVFDLKKSSHDFFYYLSEKNFDRVVNSYLKK